MSNRSELQCKIYPYGTCSPVKYVVVCSFYKGQYLLSRHKQRDTWETQGGHIEMGETPLDAAKRELFEESGVKEAVLYPVCDYLGYVATGFAHGVVFLADVRELGNMPESEMGEAVLFHSLPDELTYPNVTPVLFEQAKRIAVEKRIL